ncbi:MAG: hypothetical protein JKY30_01765 [Flavobacteriales bacterium]|nr:hypothetical protein [Flavobacteriales bacterium]
MKNILSILLIVAVFIGCKSSSKQLERGDYDAALQKSAKKIKRNPSKNDDEVWVFNDAYRMATTRDNEALVRLKRKGDPALWGKIYRTYVKMDARQNLAISLPPVGIEFDEKDYTADLKNARLKAAEYAYAKGTQLLNIDNRFEARKAYSRFLEVKTYDQYYKDVDNKLMEAKFKGTTNVFFKIADNSNVVAPKGLIAEIQRINMDELNETWKNYDTYIDTNKIYHYSIFLNIKLIDVSPEEVKENNYMESKEIEDGFDYALDANGNVKKDTLGNDIKIPKYKIITCHVKEIHQFKTARISGVIDYIDNYSDKLLKSEPITSDTKFEHHYAIANGDLNALKQSTRNKIGADPLPFPADEPLVLQAGDVLKEMTKGIIVRNKSFLK